MLLLLLVLASVALVPLGGGRPHSIAELRLRGTGFLLGAVALQVALVLAPGETNAVRIAAYLASYVLAGGFLVANRHVSGLWLIGLGAAMNFSAILANGGVMPAAGHAIATAGIAAHPGVFSNSISLAAPRLAFLGDIFAIPASWPFSNVFSLGDVCIAIGAVVTVHRTTESRLVPSGRGCFTDLAGDRSFLLIAEGHALSSLGGWTLAVALVYRLAHEAASAAELARGAAVLLGVALLLRAACAELLTRSGALDARRLVIVAEGLRVIAIVSLAFTSAPSLLHLALVAGCLGATAPAIRLVAREDRPNGGPRMRLMAEDAALVAITGLAVVAAPPIAAVIGGNGPLIAALGVLPVGAALLLWRRHGDAYRSRRSPSSELSMASRPHVVAFLVLAACFGLAAALPLQPEYPGALLSGATDVAQALVALEFVAGVFGTGIVLGAVSAPALASRVSPRRLLAASLGGMGLLLLAAGTGSLSGLLLAWLLGGVALGVAGVSVRSISDQAAGGRRSADARLQAASSAGLLLGGGTAALLGVGPPPLLAFGTVVLVATALAARRFLPRTESRESAAEELLDSSPH
ncbi:MAG: DUF5317 domain-containing protein [Actinomycetota bacterium]|nr:DUF5317 domain-containing protein [Actinomycetota bacterium]